MLMIWEEKEKQATMKRKSASKFSFVFSKIQKTNFLLNFFHLIKIIFKFGRKYQVDDNFAKTTIKAINQGISQTTRKYIHHRVHK